MWKKWLIVLLVIILLCCVGFGLYFFFNNKSKSNASIQANKEYIIQSMWNSVYSTSATGNYVNNPFESGSIINMDNNRDAYCKFSDGYKTFEIYFDESTLQFIVPYAKTNSKGLTRATIRHIYNGQIHSYDVVVDNQFIYIKASFTQNVKVASGDEYQTAYRTIERYETVMQFYVGDI